ncbi:tetratricopeptide repeat protein [Rhodobacteraceae bacterium RKSG542]|uniref:tetratricopeptide repeat protein n=1 Tax=Pseudovibrio flavus TaxID=2529854 RepID=UPI0012BBCA5A|nr:tetratricopeptide repeat protein [Pseudovibrio flavus]MTI19340.1 tetratricopeptide repeat protein [Pseudovibrio flavus]
MNLRSIRVHNRPQSLSAVSTLGDKWRASVSALALASLVMAGCIIGSGQARANNADAFGDPVTLSGSYLSGRSALLAQDLDEASRYFSVALSKDPENYYLQDRAFVTALANGEFNKALPLVEPIWVNDPDHFLSHFAAATEALKLGKYKEATALLDKGDVNPLSRLTFAIMSAWASAGIGDTQKGLEELEAVEGPAWFDLFASYSAGLLLEAEGNWEAANERYKDAYKSDPGALRIANAYARSLAATGKQKEAIEVLDAYDFLVPDHPVLLQTRKVITDGKTFEPTVNSPAEGVAEALYSLGAAISRDGQELSAVYLQSAAHLDPSLDATAIALGALFDQMGKPERAIDYLSKVDESSPMKREAEIQIGLHYNTLDRLDDARKHLEALIKSDPKDVEAAASLANVLRSHSQFADAEKAYSLALDGLTEIKGNDWTLLYFRGITRERLGKWPEAEKDFREALTYKKDQPMILNYLGYSLVDRGEKLDEALGMIESAVNLRPKDGYIVDSLGWAFYKLGRYEEAVEQLERAVDLRPQDPIINDHLGDAYWKVGRKLEARFKWNHARDLNPEPKDLERILEKIANGLPEEPQKESAEAANTSANDG